jgi:hypothetical protein
MVVKFKVPILIMAMIIDQIHNKCAFTVDSLESVPRIPGILFLLKNIR